VEKDSAYLCSVPPQHPAVPPGGWQPPGSAWNQPPPGAWQQPPPGGWNQPPPAGWQAPPPPPPPVIKRIPEDQPFTVRHDVRKRALFFGAVAAVTVLLVGCVPAVTIGDPALIVGVFGCLFVLMGSLLGLQLYLLTSGGPALAVGPNGLWVKTRPTRGQAIWLPWEAVERIYRRRWAFDKMLCVKPRDPRAGGNLGAFTALDSGMQQLVFGTGFTAPLTFADRPEGEIMGAVAHFSAGRVRIE
jgi:hypothetical protein